MKILALRLAEVGPFSEPVALEDLSGRLDVLTGPNELGKSTLFTALGMLLGERHTSTARAVGALRPDAGGAPLIEADIEIGGRMLRLRKRFLAQRMALLRDLGTGEIWHGADAEAAADELLGGDGRREMRGLLWVAQGASFGLPEKLDQPLVAGVASLIEREAADTAGAGHLRRLTAEARVRLELLVTSKTGKARAGGPLDQARRRRDELAARVEAALARAAAAAARIDRRDALMAERATVLHPDAAQALDRQAQAARKAVEYADKARERLRTSTERVGGRQLTSDQARQTLDRYTKLATEAGRLAQAVADRHADLVSLAARRDDREAGGAGARQELEAADAVLVDVRQQLKAAHASALRRSALAELAEIDGRLAQARAATTAAKDVEARLSANRATDAAIERIRQLGARLDALVARIATQAPRAAITYLPGAHARIRINGTALADGAQITIDRPLELVIEGIGTITIAPGLTAGRAPTVEHDECKAELTRALAAIGVIDAAEAQERSTERRRDEAEAMAVRAQLTASAPKGIAALEAARQAAAVRAGVGTLEGTLTADGQAADGEPADTTDLERRVRDLEQDLARRRSVLLPIEVELKELATAVTRLEAQQAADQRRLADLGSELPVEAEREAFGRRLAEQLESAAAGLSDAVRERTVWAEAAPQGSAYDALMVEAKRAADAVALAATRRAGIEREIAEVEGALRRDGEEGVGAEVAGLQEEFAAAEARLLDLDTDLRGLEMLTTRLERIGADHRDQVLRPLVARLDPLLARLFPQARLEMDGPLLVARLERPERTDPLQRVSGGTREQIATLVRIAYADLMAARGIALPLVLDDALVFSDDRRLEIMVELLAVAAQRHQVIVLSCHERALQPLMAAQAAKQLALVPWRDSDALHARAPTRTQKSRTTGPASQSLL